MGMWPVLTIRETEEALEKARAKRKQWIVDQLALGKKSQRQIAREADVSHETVSQIAKKVAR